MFKGFCECENAIWLSWGVGKIRVIYFHWLANRIKVGICGDFRCLSSNEREVLIAEIKGIITSTTSVIFTHFPLIEAIKAIEVNWLTHNLLKRFPRQMVKVWMRGLNRSLSNLCNIFHHSRNCFCCKPPCCWMFCCFHNCTSYFMLWKRSEVTIDARTTNRSKLKS